VSLAPECILTAERVGKVFVDAAGGRVVAFQDVSVAVYRSEFVSIVGPSGCGKSTFLRIVAGLDRPTSGEVRAAGHKVEGPGAERGMVFQEYALLPWKTTRANVEFGPLLNRVPRAERERIARHFIELVGLKGFEDKYPHQLSGGMRQRAAVARSLANDPAILLMDEPFAAVDAMTRQRLQEELAALTASQSTTVLFVTHSIDEAVFLSDRVIVLSGHPGRVIADVPVDFPRPRLWSDLLQDQRFRDVRDKLSHLIHSEAAASAERVT